MRPLRRIVVVGGSIAALTAVQTLRMEGFDGDVTMLSDEDRGPYTRVPLSKDVLAGRTDPADIALPTPQDVDLRLRTRALGLDLGNRLVRTTTGAVPYDGLVVATGARARRLGSDAAGLVLRSHHDGARLRAAVRSAASVRVVGGGFLGMEVASTCVDLGKQVTVVDVAPPLVRLVGHHVADRIRGAAEARGVRFRVGVETDDPGPADLVVCAVGDVPNTEWLAGAVPLHGGAVVVDDRGRVAPDVVAAGDVATTRTPAGHRRLPTWTNAVEQARAATLALLHGDDAAPYRPSEYCWTEQFGVDLKLVGELAPVGGPSLREARGDGELLTWPQTVIAVNHPIRPAQLKRLVRGTA